MNKNGSSDQKNVITQILQSLYNFISTLACEPPQFQVAIATFGPIYEELVNALMRKAMYSLSENEWTGDQRETFRCYRTDIADTIMYCYVRKRQSAELSFVICRRAGLKLDFSKLT